MEKIICKDCGTVISGAEYTSVRAAFDKHVEDEHATASDANTALLSACYSYLTQYALGVRSSKLKALRLCQRIKELSPDATKNPTDLKIADPEEIPGTPDSREALRQIMEELGLSERKTGTRRTANKKSV